MPTTGQDGRTYLTLSEGPDLEAEHHRVSAYIERELRRITRMRRHHLAAAAAVAERRLIEYVMGRR